MRRAFNIRTLSSYIRLLLLLPVVLFPLSAGSESIRVASIRGESMSLYKDYYALVIGVSRYEKRPALPHAVESARGIASLLERMGFRVSLVTDPSSQELKKALNDLVHGPGREPERGIVVYYAGHGETQASPDGSRVGWIIPRDCPSFQNDPAGFARLAISMKDIASYSVDIQSRHVLMFFDTFFSGSAFSVETPVLTAITEKTAAPARQYIIAGNAGESVTDQRAFVRFLLKGLEGDADIVADGYITGSELGVYLQQRAGEATNGKQRPQYAKINVPSLAGGDFVFQRGAAGRVEAGSGPTRFTAKTDPEDALVNILNIKQRYSPGMELKPGKYHVEVAARGYQKERTWITLAEGENKTIEISLKKLGQAITNSLGMKFVLVEPGTFMMGNSSNERGALPDETRHRVTLTGGYYLQATEVTVAQFRQFAVATGYKTEAETAGGCWINVTGSGWKKNKESNWKSPGLRESAAFRQSDEQPVTCISWNDAQAYIKWLSSKEGKVYGLPTEAEWEYACRAGTTTPFAYGKCLSSNQANYGGIDEQYSNCKDGYRKSQRKTTKVASLAANPWGLFDMHGNVAEWCEDWYGPYPSGAVTDPKGPSSGTDRVFRGCHWLSSASECRSASRASFPPSYASDAVGFRLTRRP
jgi:formylglycine-generating enzyme required for sulfatase activity